MDNYPDVAAPLAAYVEPPVRRADVGSSALFNCSITGHPVTQVTWFKDGRPLVVDDHVTLSTQTTLLLSQVLHSDMGMYQCLVSNGEENAQGSSQLNLGGKLNNPNMH